MRKSVTGAWISAASAAVLAMAGVKRAKSLQAIDPELYMAPLWLPISLTPALRSLSIRQQRRAPPAQLPSHVEMAEVLLERPNGGEPLRVLTLQRITRTSTSAARPAILWIHGGGYVIGRPEQDLGFISHLLRHLDVIFIAVAYRLAPEHPFPAPP